jgi:hypothetical protein
MLQTPSKRERLLRDSAIPQCAVNPFPGPAFRAASGEQTPSAPRWSGSVTTSYGLLLPGNYKLPAQLSPYFSSSYNRQDPYLLGTAGYVRLDARLTLEKLEGRWAIDPIGKNLADRIIIVANNSPPPPGHLLPIEGTTPECRGSIPLPLVV